MVQHFIKSKQDLGQQGSAWKDFAFDNNTIGFVKLNLKLGWVWQYITHIFLWTKDAKTNLPLVKYNYQILASY